MEICKDNSKWNQTNEKQYLKTFLKVGSFNLVRRDRGKLSNGLWTWKALQKNSNKQFWISLGSRTRKLPFWELSVSNCTCYFSLWPFAQNSLISLSAVFLVCTVMNVYWPSQCKYIHDKRVISNLLPSYMIMKSKGNYKECGCVSSMLKACILTASRTLVKGHF